MGILFFVLDSWKTDCVWFGRIALWDTTRIRFGKFASLFAFVLFAGSCVVRISYESFLDFGFSEFFMFLEWRTAFISFRFQCVLINTSVKEGSLPSLTNHLAELSQLDRSSPSAVMRLLNEWLVSAKSNQ